MLVLHPLPLIVGYKEKESQEKKSLPGFWACWA